MKAVKNCVIFYNLRNNLQNYCLKDSSMTSFENIQIKISPRERMNEQKNNKDEVNPPKCFYHP